MPVPQCEQENTRFYVLKSDTMDSLQLFQTICLCVSKGIFFLACMDQIHEESGVIARLNLQVKP